MVDAITEASRSSESAGCSRNCKGGFVDIKKVQKLFSLHPLRKYREFFKKRQRKAAMQDSEFSGYS
jgi:hypothetical protein